MMLRTRRLAGTLRGPAYCRTQYTVLVLVLGVALALTIVRLVVLVSE